MAWRNFRVGLAYATVLTFVLFLFSSWSNYNPASIVGSWQTEGYPDFSRYKHTKTLSDKQFPLNSRTGRVILVGDIHGMNKSFHHLLNKLSFQPHSDQLIHIGDIVAKGPHLGSLSTLSYMAANDIIGVRGNHDQKVIEWRSWIMWVNSDPEGRAWLETIQAEWDQDRSSGVSLEVWMEEKMKKHKSKWWKKIPEGWKLFSDHFQIARYMSREEYEYLVSLPLALYAPSAHTYLVHAGLLSSDVTLSPRHKRQPLAHPPYLPPSHVTGAALASRKRLLRRLQEEAILSNIPQNEEPWVLLNMRGVTEDHTVTRKKDGTPWADLWNADMSRCGGYDVAEFHDVSSGGKDHSPLPCMPSMVVFGHAASRGLDVKRWSVGLDSGCVYGRRLTALVLGGGPQHIEGEPHDDGVEVQKSTIRFGDNESARIFSVRCHVD